MDGDNIEPQIPSTSNLNYHQGAGSAACVDEESPLVRVTRPQSKYGSLPSSSSWPKSFAPNPCTRENKSNRRPFHYPAVRKATSGRPSAKESHLYTRYKYYSRLRAPVHIDDHALVIPDHVIPGAFFLPYIPGQSKATDGKQASVITIIAIWNTMMGTSLLTMPWAFNKAGFACGIIIMVGMAALCLYTSYRILTLQKIMGVEGEMLELPSLCRYLWPGSFGAGIEGLAVTFSLLTLFGALIVYWVLMSNFLFNTGEAIYEALHEDSTNDSSPHAEVMCPTNETSGYGTDVFSADDSFRKWWQQDFTVPLYLVLPFLMLLHLKNLKVFTYFNSLGGIAMLAIFSFVMSESAHWGIHLNLVDPSSEFYVPPFKTTFMTLTGTLSLAYFIHNCTITILKGNRHPENNARDLSIAFTMVALTYIPIGVAFVTTFPLPKYCIADNLLDNFPPHNKVLAVVRGFLLFQMTTVFPLLVYFLRTQLFQFIVGPDYVFRMWHATIVNSVLLFACVLVAVFYPNIGFIIRWVGAVAGLVYVFILPCLMYITALHKKNLLHWYQAVPHIFIIVLGLANFGSQFYLG